jgi:serine/threonine-protein kinase
MYDSALAVLEPLVETAPSTDWVLEGIGAIKRRQGKLDESIEYLTRARELDPRVATSGTELGLSYSLIRDYDSALPLVENYVEANPQGGFGYASMARLSLANDGDVERARSWIREGDEAGARRPYLDYQAFRTEMFGRSFQAVIDRLQTASVQALGEFQFMYYPVDLLRGFAYEAAGDAAAATDAFEAAAALLEAARDSVPDDERFHGSLGLAYAGLGRKDDAIREGLLGVELMPMEKEHWRGSHRVEELAHVYAMVGEPDLAIDRLEFLLSVPGELSVAQLRLDPAWDNLRGDPRFEALIE